jgi:aryl-alcohol dehydrogenase-like predicted oxidoreductase
MQNKFQLRRLGKSDLMVSPIGLGCWQFSKGKSLGGKFWPVLQDEEIKDIVEVSLEGGINWFDTAESYGGGESERALSKALKQLGKTSKDVVIATKWFPLFRTAKSITQTIDKRLENLEGFCIDLYQIHQPFSFSAVKAQMKAMAQLVKEEKIRFIGVSNFSAKKMKRAHEELSKFGLHLVSNQVRYNLLDRKIETNGILETAKEFGISIIAYSPLAQGLLSGKFHDDPELIRSRSGYRKYMRAFKQKGLEKSQPVINALKELARKYQVSLSQIALNWLIQFQGETVVAIPGATKVDHVKDNIGAMKFMLTNDELDYLARALS